MHSAKICLKLKYRNNTTAVTLKYCKWQHSVWFPKHLIISFAYIFCIILMKTRQYILKSKNKSNQKLIMSLFSAINFFLFFMLITNLSQEVN